MKYYTPKEIEEYLEILEQEIWDNIWDNNIINPSF